ncbi:MAG: PAS domain S-box protein [Bacteroidetes bacterium]|nr:PAS domain S-box protein [Bacteroidota bacterium]
MDLSKNDFYSDSFMQLISSNILRVIDDSIIATNLNGKIVYWSKGAERIFGYSAKEMLGKSPVILYPDMNEEMLKVDLEKIINGEDYIGEWKGKRKNGKDVWISIHTTVMKNAEGEITGFIGVSQDITERKRLSAYRAELANIIENSDDAIESMDLEGNILSWNRAAEKIYGYTAKEMIGKNASILYTKTSKDELNGNLLKIKSGKSIKNLETKRKNKNGEIIHVLISFSPLKDENNTIIGVSVITRDLTEHKQTVKELLESEIKYQAIFENSGEGLLLMTDSFIDCNKRLCDMWECTKKDIIGKNPGEFSPKFQADGLLSEQKAKQYIEEAYRTGYQSFYWQHLTKKGNKLETKITLSRIKIKGDQHLIAVVQDLTEMFKYQNKLKTKSKELLEHNEEINQLNDELNESNLRLKIINKQIDLSEKKFRAAFKTSPDAININRLNDGAYIEINSGFTKMTGFTDEDVLHKNPYTINIWYNDKDRERLINDLKKKKELTNYEINYKTKNGDVKTGLLSASIIEIDGVEHYISITRDISERKEYEEKLKEARKKAEESDMLKSAFLANMSHEIRTPMNAILGFGQLLREKKLDREKQNKFLDIIVVRSKNLLQIINDIIDISKIEANQLNLEIRQFSLNKVLYELFSSFEAELAAQNKEGLKLEFKAELDRDASHIESDEVRLKQILTNLISNAIKFTEKGKIEFGYKVEKEVLHFFVQDTGIGIPQSAMKHIFERFRQADDSNTRQFGGTGLGLSISKQLVQMMGGEIWVESEENKGSVFHFTIPFNPVNKNLETEKMKQEELDLSKKCFMLVEDDTISMAYLEEILQPTKVKIIKAFDGEQAVEKFRTEEVDLILMDIHLPKMSGNTATKEIRKIDKSIPIIAQSAFAMPGDKKESFEHGCDEYITKPIDSRLLFSTIKKLLI